MKIRVNGKSLGKRKQAVEEKICEIAGCPGTVRELIEAVVAAEVESYNRRVAQEAGEASGQLQGLLRYMTKAEIQDRAQGGKIGFGAVYSEKKADLEAAKENALQSFEDGIYRIFLDGRPLEDLQETITVTEENVFTFVRLTMLAGRMW